MDTVIEGSNCKLCKLLPLVTNSTLWPIFRQLLKLQLALVVKIYLEKSNVHICIYRFHIVNSNIWCQEIINLFNMNPMESTNAWQKWVIYLVKNSLDKHWKEISLMPIVIRHHNKYNVSPCLNLCKRGLLPNSTSVS